MNIPVIFEDTNILVINKPPGLVVHPYDFSTEKTLLDFLEESSPEICKNISDNTITLQDGRTINLGGIVHKLDRDTSGVMVIAKNKNTFDELQSQFRSHLTTKKYIAVVEGILQENTLTINSPLGRNKKEYKQVANPENPRGELREALTLVRVLQRDTKTNTTLVELTPKTGRTHQLRAHMTSTGHPIVGDKAYGSVVESPRIMLHAQSLSFELDGKIHTYTADVPEGFILTI